MTEHEWLSSRTTPMAMFRHVESRANARRLRLLGIQSCRLIWDYLSEKSRQLIDVSEQCLENPNDGTSQRQLDAILETYHLWDYQDINYCASAAISGRPEHVADCIDWILDTVSDRTTYGERRAAVDQIRSHICDLFREIVGNPFRPWKTVPSFLDGGVLQPDGRVVRLSGTAVELAETIHALQAFDRLPILADALEESGISDPEILSHCREGTGHVRGCWALDVVRGKS